MRAAVENFSAGYYMVDGELVSYGGDDVVMAHDFFGELVNHVSRPLLRIGDAHYWPETEAAVPYKTIAVPEGVDFEEGDPILLAKDNTALRLVKTGQEDTPT